MEPVARELKDRQDAGQGAEVPSREFAIEGMSCQGCADTITAALGKIPGVESAKVSFRDKKAVVVARTSQVPDEKILAAVAEAGYQGRPAVSGGAPAGKTDSPRHAACERETAIMMEPIGIIHSPYKDAKGTPIQGVFSKDVEAYAELDPKYTQGLKDLDTFSHAILLYQFHLSDKVEIVGKPYLENEEHGIFAMRHPNRPNHIGYSVVKIKKTDGNKLYFTEVDILDGTPLLDIKPYVKEFDSRDDAKSGWIERHFQGGPPKKTRAP